MEIRNPELILSSLTTFFLALLIGLVFSHIFKRLRVPWAVSLVIGGIVLGPNALGIFELNEIILFLSEVGVIFLMFLAGMEVKFSAIRDVWKESTIVGVMTGMIPALIGFAIGHVFGYGITVSILLAIILMSSSFAVVMPALEVRGLIYTKLGRVIIASTMFQDIFSLIVLGVLLQFITPDSALPIPIWAILLFFALLAGIVVKSIPKLHDLFEKMYPSEEGRKDFYEDELKLVIVILLGAAIIFEFFRFETIVGAFFAGLLISEVVESRVLTGKVHILGYGLFIPVFFVTVGAWADLSLFGETHVWALAATIVFFSSVSKFFSGWISGMMVGFDAYESSLIGLTSMPQLITTLAVVVVSNRLELLPPEVVTSVIILAILTVIMSPMITNQVMDRAPTKKSTKPKKKIEPKYH